MQNRNQLNMHASEGLAIREVSISDAGKADYLLVASGKAIGILEAKPVGTTLKGREDMRGSFRTMFRRGGYRCRCPTSASSTTARRCRSRRST